MSDSKAEASSRNKQARAPAKDNLIYVSPLPYESFSQRPHKFVHWFHQRTGGRVLWLNPYPTRLPRWSDLGKSRSLDRFDSAGEAWLQIHQVRGLPIEPLPGSKAINGHFWRDAFYTVQRFVRENEPMLAIGKPSTFANELLDRFPEMPSVYDMMDNFAAFYDGVSSRAIRRNEARIVARAGTVLCSSTRLLQTTRISRPDARLVLNAFDADVPLSVARQQSNEHTERPRIFGYVGTIAQWFDWDLICALALARRADTIRIIGPLFNLPTRALPPNVELRPAVPHLEALNQMAQFDVALIPFKQTPLTACVDPIKYYEYRAMGLAILTTPFGEMAERKGQDGIFLFGEMDLAELLERALSYRMEPEAQSRFSSDNAWKTRFDRAGLLTAQ